MRELIFTLIIGGLLGGCKMKKPSKVDSGLSNTCDGLIEFINNDFREGNCDLFIYDKDAIDNFNTKYRICCAELTKSQILEIFGEATITTSWSFAYDFYKSCNKKDGKSGSLEFFYKNKTDIVDVIFTSSLSTGH